MSQPEIQFNLRDAKNLPPHPSEVIGQKVYAYAGTERFEAGTVVSVDARGVCTTEIDMVSYLAMKQFFAGLALGLAYSIGFEP